MGKKVAEERREEERVTLHINLCLLSLLTIETKESFQEFELFMYY